MNSICVNGTESYSRRGICGRGTVCRIPTRDDVKDSAGRFLNNMRGALRHPTQERRYITYYQNELRSSYDLIDITISLMVAGF